MPRKPLTRIATPETLAQIDPSFLAELLESHAEFLDRHGIKSGARLEPAGITRLSEVLLDPTHDAPASLIDALLHIDEMADEDGMQKLLEALKHHDRQSYKDLTVLELERALFWGGLWFHAFKTAVLTAVVAAAGMAACSRST